MMNFFSVIILSLLIIGLCLGCDSSANSYTAKVAGISDGDTVKVLRDREQIKIRLAGIDCPEKGQPWGEKAKQAVSDLIARKSVRIEVLDTDRYGRTVGRIYLNAKNINQTLVEAGTAGSILDTPRINGYLHCRTRRKKQGAGFGLYHYQSG